MATAALSVVPAPVLAGMVALLMRGMRRRHPRLMQNFGRLDPATVHVLPTDLPHRFAIDYGDGRMTVRVLLEPEPPAADATIRASLANLIEMLEGRIDGDAMFFTRGIEITGSTSVIVAVRNTLDREEIVLRDDIAALFGPLERPARRVGRALEHAAARARARVGAMHAAMHAEDSAGRDLGAELDALRNEVRTLKTRLAKLDVKQQKRTAEVAATGAP
jgi:predicted lipid carrier protein YhbT